jgi:S-DNA-T family DNA segregation ATPase FtsK/SpoIIIE
MAKKKTTTANKKAASAKTSGRTTKKSPKQEAVSEQTQRISVREWLENLGIPFRFFSATVIFICFALLLLTFLAPGGVFFLWLESLLLGLIGKVGFFAAIPTTLYLFTIHAFSKNRPVRMRTICLIVFILLCGSIGHILSGTVEQNYTFAGFGKLYNDGIAGLSGGVVCGIFAQLIALLCGKATLVFLIPAALLTLLAGMQITIPSIVRAIRNRPRDEQDDVEVKAEPAAIVVNHIANKRIEHKHNRRLAAQQAAEAEEDVEYEEEYIPAEPPVAPKKEHRSRASEIMRQIENDVESPVAAAYGEEMRIDPVSRMPLLNFDVDVDDEPAPVKVTPVKVKQPKEKAVKEKVTAQEAAESAAEVAEEIAQAEVEAKPVYSFPPIDLLKNAADTAGDGMSEMRENTRRLNETLASFKIEAHIINVTRGPSVTRYEVELEKGVRLNKITTAADDIALSLGASGVRIAAVPGKISVVGIEVPNKSVNTVSLREVIESNAFSGAKSKSSFAVGKDIGGNAIVGNIAKLPHMLIAGTTGSGKSVCMNSIIISILYKASPEDVKLIMVDPKMVELGIYNGIPHLLIPVVTDPKKAAGSLQWAVTEMMRRYKAMSDVGVRDLESYNSIVEGQETGAAKLPQVVVIIDELADLMLVAAKEVEESICRIAQMGRAAGIHLVIATQRPSADVITGLMKANIPSRIAFAVASAMESRIILDTQGAEKLVGRGDMLFAPIGSGKPKRVQGCFVSDPEVEAVATYVKSNFTSTYDQQVMEEIEKKAAQTGNGKAATAAEPEPNADEMEGDEMLPAAVDVILETGQASVSMLQRRLKLGYARAARIVDEMEERGIVGPFMGSKPRTILVTKEQWEAMRSGGSAQMAIDDLEEADEEFQEEFE